LPTLPDQDDHSAQAPTPGIDMTDHEHGSMDTAEQERTFAGFMRMTIWALVLIFAALAFMALTQT